MTNILNWATTNNSERPNNFSSDEYIILSVNITDVLNNMHVGFKLDIKDESGGINAISNRLSLAIEHFMAKKPMDYPEVGYSIHNKTIDFTNGRHRTLAAFKMGHDYIPMFVSKLNIKEFKSLIRTTPIDDSLKTFLKSKENEYNRDEWKSYMIENRNSKKTKKKINKND
jgi:hypothetical protein